MTKIINELAEQVRNAILTHEAFKESWKINVLENGGVITLRGAVPNKEYLALVESIAKNQEGVISVNNEIDIDASLKEEDLEDLDLDEGPKVPPTRQGPYGNPKP